MGSNHREYLRQAIDAEIDSLKASFQQSLQSLSQRRNELAPISSLPTEIITDILLLASAKRDDSGLAWLNVTHVCRQWREITLNQRLFWSHINFTTLTLAGAAEMLARAKEAPLHFEAKVMNWDDARYNAFERKLRVHASHIRHLEIIGTSNHLYTTLRRALIASPAPILENLSLLNLHSEGVFLPNNFFKGTTPRLFSLELQEIMISWNSPLLRGLRYLKIYKLNKDNRLSVTEWLDALEEMPQLKELVLHTASPLADGFKFPSDIKRTATLPALTHLDISATARDCALSLAHLVLPALTSLILEAESSNDGTDVLILLPYVTQHAHGPQDTQPLQSMLFCRGERCTHIIAWPEPDFYMTHNYYDWLKAAKRTARVVLSITRKLSWHPFTYDRVLDAALEAFPLGSLVTLTAPEHRARLDKQFWLCHAPRWPLLENVHLAPWAARGLREMLLLEDNGGHESPLLPSLRQLDLLGDTLLTKRRTLRLCDALKKRVEQGVPLRVLDLRTCNWTIDAVRLLRTFVAEVRGPKEDTSWQEEGPSVRDPETCVFYDVFGEDDSDLEDEGR
jgi:hypothetical protein